MGLATCGDHDRRRLRSPRSGCFDTPAVRRGWLSHPFLLPIGAGDLPRGSTFNLEFGPPSVGVTHDFACDPDLDNKATFISLRLAACGATWELTFGLHLSTLFFREMGSPIKGNHTIRNRSVHRQRGKIDRSKANYKCTLGTTLRTTSLAVEDLNGPDLVIIIGGVTV